MNAERRKEIIRYIAAYRGEKGYPPTVREIMDGVQVKSTSTMYGYLQRLERDGFLTMERDKNRSIRPTAKGMDEIGLPESSDIQFLKNLNAVLVQENYELRKQVRGYGH